ncbi:NAD(P)-binding domain-containing protein [Allorhodopirellula solitaria]|uniref:Ferredoxin--NADP reductase n=1 Tax=Allorhodopirellula solitaria TaxID=2527987 RepID=A0A5C5YI52_9BACT|nr:NAD(P)-binding domain-containing protein [Allorhodopirellula solitaria]TWT74362.1 Ferredoxin--NADP reductase [Allorhodopirellula solitaria]
MSNVLPAVVIGAGPSGIETAVELRRRGIDAEVFDAGPLGHTISWWAPGTRWFSSNDRISIAGVPLQTVDQAKASREEYLNYLRSVVDQFAVPVHTFKRLVSITPAAEPLDDAPSCWRLGFRRTSGEPSAAEQARGGVSRSVDTSARSHTDFFLDARAVVLAIGGTDFPNRLGVPGEELPHVDGFLREIHRYHGRRVLIVGGRNSAVEAAIRLHRGGAKVSLCYHREQLPSDGIKYWLRPEIEGLIRSGSIEAYFGSRVAEISSRHVTIRSQGEGDSAADTEVEADDVLTLIGYHQDQSLLGQLGLVSDAPSGAPLYDTETMQTSHRGIYVAGTAVGGTQSSRYQVFLENCHEHPRKIADHLCRERVASAPGGGPGRGNTRDDGLSKRIAMQPES